MTVWDIAWGVVLGFGILLALYLAAAGLLIVCLMVKEALSGRR